MFIVRHDFTSVTSMQILNFKSDSEVTFSGYENFKDKESGKIYSPLLRFDSWCPDRPGLTGFTKTILNEVGFTDRIMNLNDVTESIKAQL